MENKHTIFGLNYVTLDCLHFGDYGGAGSVGLANIRDLTAMTDPYFVSYSDIDNKSFGPLGRWGDADLEAWLENVISSTPPILVEAYGGYGSRSMYVLALETADETVIGSSAMATLEEIHETLDALHDYPVISEETMSEVEMEWEDEAWESFIQSDLAMGAGDCFDDLIDSVEPYECYRAAMETHNEYPIPEYSGCYVRIDVIKDTYQANIKRQIITALMDGYKVFRAV